VIATLLAWLLLRGPLLLVAGLLVFTALLAVGDWAARRRYRRQLLGALTDVELRRLQQRLASRREVSA
jgi:thiosulfate reductase cytochrome b subunit